MRLVKMLLIVITAALPMAANAVDVDFGAIVDGVYDSNVYRTSRNQKGDGSFRFTPTIKITLPGRKFSGNVRYAPTYEVFTTYSDANGLTHDVGNTFNWLPGEKTNVSMTNRFRALDVLNFGDPDTIDEGTTPIPNNDIRRERVYLFGSTLSVEHAISSRWDSRTSVDFHLFNSERRLTSDSKAVSGFQAFDYGLTASDRIGGGGGVSAQFFDAAAGLPASNTYVYQLFGSYSRNFGESTILTLRLGPALIHTVQDSFSSSSTQDTYPSIVIDNTTTVGAIRDSQNIPIRDDNGQGLTDSTVVAAGSVVVPDAGTCLNDGANPVLLEGSRCAFTRLLRNDGAFPNEQAPITAGAFDSQTEVMLEGSNQGSNDMRWTLFGEIALTHYWLPTLTSTLSYNRRESPTNGQGTSAIADSVFFRTSWQPSELWDLSLQTSYVRRESPTDLSRTFLQVDADGTFPPVELVRSNSLQTVVEKSNSIATHRWAVTLRAARRVTRRVSASFRVSYTDQRSQHTSRSPNDFGNFLAIVGVKYDFDPFRF